MFVGISQISSYFSCHPTDVIDSVTDRDVIEDRAATKIQAEIRGFLIRRHLQQEKKEGNEAAKKIQAYIRLLIRLMSNLFKNFI